MICKHCGKSSEELTPRDLEVLECLAEGMFRKEICRKLKMGDATVDLHCQHIFQKFKVPNAVSAVLEGIRRGLIQMPESKETK